MDSYHLTAPEPSALGLQKAVREAIHDVDYKKISFINAHATGTKINDLVEGRFLKANFPETPVWASKGVTGHTLAAAGILEAIFSILALRHKLLPKTQGFTTPDPDINLIPTTENIPIIGNMALSTSLGFGGGASAILLTAAES